MRDVVKLFVGLYNKKTAEHPVDASAMHLKVVGGDHLDLEAEMEDIVALGDECCVLGGEFVASVALA